MPQALAFEEPSEFNSLHNKRVVGQKNKMLKVYNTRDQISKSSKMVRVQAYSSSWSTRLWENNLVIGIGRKARAISQGQCVSTII